MLHTQILCYFFVKCNTFIFIFLRNAYQYNADCRTCHKLYPYTLISKRERESYGKDVKHWVPHSLPALCTIGWIRHRQKLLWPCHERAINHAAISEAKPAGKQPPRMPLAQHASFPACIAPSLQYLHSFIIKSHRLICRWLALWIWR